MDSSSAANLRSPHTAERITGKPEANVNCCKQGFIRFECPLSLASQNDHSPAAPSFACNQDSAPWSTPRHDREETEFVQARPRSCGIAWRMSCEDHGVPCAQARCVSSSLERRTKPHFP